MAGTIFVPRVHTSKLTCCFFIKDEEEFWHTFLHTHKNPIVNPEKGKSLSDRVIFATLSELILKATIDDSEDVVVYNQIEAGMDCTEIVSENWRFFLPVFLHPRCLDEMYEYIKGFVITERNFVNILHTMAECASSAAENGFDLAEEMEKHTIMTRPFVEIWSSVLLPCAASPNFMITEPSADAMMLIASSAFLLFAHGMIRERMTHVYREIVKHLQFIREQKTLKYTVMPPELSPHTASMFIHFVYGQKIEEENVNEIIQEIHRNREIWSMEEKEYHLMTVENAMNESWKKCAHFYASYLCAVKQTTDVFYAKIDLMWIMLAKRRWYLCRATVLSYMAILMLYRSELKFAAYSGQLSTIGYMALKEAEALKKYIIRSYARFGFKKITDFTVLLGECSFDVQKEYEDMTVVYYSGVNRFVCDMSDEMLSEIVHTDNKSWEKCGSGCDIRHDLFSTECLFVKL